MIKKYITVAGIDNRVSILSGDRELDQGKVIMIMIDRYLESGIIFSILKREFPNIVLISSGLISILGFNKIVLQSGSIDDQILIDNHLMSAEIVLSVIKQECFYTSNITSPNLINTKYPLGKLPDITKIVSFIS